MSIPLITTSRWDVEDGHTLEGYLRTGGYEGLRRAIEMTPDQVCPERYRSWRGCYKARV